MCHHLRWPLRQHRKFKVNNEFMKKILYSFASGALLAVLLGACATTPPDENAAETATPANATPHLSAKPLAPIETNSNLESTSIPPKAPMILPGTGNFIDQKAATKPAAPVTRTTSSARYPDGSGRHHPQLRGCRHSRCDQSHFRCA